MTKQEIISSLQLTEHVEGGYFSETYRSTDTMDTDRIDTQRNIITSIYYLLTDDRPIGHFHMNKSDIVHYFQGGSPLKYYIIHPDGKLEIAILGNNYAAGEVGQLIVKGGCWKATELTSGEWGLLGEAVTPGFDYRDMRLAMKSEMKELYPDLFSQIEHLVYYENEVPTH